MKKKYKYLPPLMQTSVLYPKKNMYLPGAIGRPVRIEIRPTKVAPNNKIEDKAVVAELEKIADTDWTEEDLETNLHNRIDQLKDGAKDESI